MHNNSPVKKHYLFPGAIFAAADAHLVTTVLGSCISVCLWDPVNRLGGINHYLLPLWNGEGLPTPRYGNVAIPRLIEKLRGFGADPKKLEAKVFGGSALWHKAEGLMSIGDRNFELAHDLLGEAGIPIVKADVGGNRGRKIIYDTAEGAVLLRRHRLREQGGLALPEAQKNRRP